MNKKFHYGKKEYVQTFIAVVLVLFVIRLIFPSVLQPILKTAAPPAVTALQDSVTVHAVRMDSLLESPHRIPRGLTLRPDAETHRIWSVSSYDRTFPDLNDLQLATAGKIGIAPLPDRESAGKCDYRHLVYAGMSPYYTVKRLSNSIPYLVPRAQLLLNHIGRTFIDSLMVKHIRPSKIIVTSFTRTEEDVTRLRRHNPNATDRSCHCRGTTFDISYSKFSPICDPDSTPQPQVRDDTLKWVLSEVLRDQRIQGLCYIKYEVKQGCFHITVR